MNHLVVPATLDDPVTMFSFLDRIALPLPAAARAMPAHGLSLAAAGVTFTTSQVDAALAKHEMTVEERLRVKFALGRHRLLRN